MVYISGSCDTLAQLKEIDGYQGSLEEYHREFNAQNGGSCPNANARLFPYYPYILICEPPVDMEGAQEAVSVIKNFPQRDRERMHLMQTQGIDMLTHLALSEIFERARHYARMARDWLNEPLVTTPWNFINSSLTNQSAPDLIGASADITKALIKSSFPYEPLDKLSYHMMEMDKSNRELARLNLIKGKTNDLNLYGAKEELRLNVKMHKGEIKRILPGNLDNATHKHLRKGYTIKVIRGIRNGTLSARLARKAAKSANPEIQAKSLLSELQFMTKTGLEAFRKGITNLETVSDGAGSAGTYLSLGLVAYDTERAYYEKDGVMKTFTSEMAGLGISSYMGTAVLSRVVIGVGALTGEEVLVGGLLICSASVGWIVLGVGLLAAGVGLLAAGYEGEKTTEVIQYLWEPENRKEVWEDVKSKTHAAEKHISEAWASSLHWVRNFYAGSD